MLSISACCIWHFKDTILQKKKPFIHCPLTLLFVNLTLKLKVDYVSGSCLELVSLVSSQIHLSWCTKTSVIPATIDSICVFITSIFF